MLRVVPIGLVIFLCSSLKADVTDIRVPLNISNAICLLQGEGEVPEKGGEESRLERVRKKTEEKIRRMRWSISGFIDLFLPVTTRGDMNPGFGVALQGISEFYLTEFKKDAFPFPTIVPFRLEINQTSGQDDKPGTSSKTSVSSLLFLFKADIGVDLFWKSEEMKLFPFAGVGSGFESVSGGVKYKGTDFVFTFQFGLGYMFYPSKDIFLFGRCEYCLLFGASNVKGALSLGGGVGYLFG